MLNLKCCGVFFLLSVIPSTDSSVNVALNKPATQINTYSTFVAAKAVDGNINQVFSGGSCSFTDSTTEAWWQVNLEKTSEIKIIKIYYRNDPLSITRLNGFKAYLTMMKDNWRNSVPCYTDTNKGNREDITVVNNCTGQGIYVTIFNNYRIPPSNAVLELCEVQVYGCESGMYGNNTCNQACSSNCVDGRCDPDIGDCLLGCQAGWKGEQCRDPCSDNSFGANCSSLCHCRTGGCNHINGTCTIPGCQNGWKSISCSDTCDNNHFGINCGEICYCSDGSCHHITGKCDSTGCQQGWKGESCSTKCASNEFGSECRFQCNCLTGGCNSVSGMCETQGCQTGWTGKKCDEKCNPGTFGNGCVDRCRCKSGACNHISGLCEIRGCVDGWQGESCSERVIPDSNNLVSGVVGGVIGFILAATIFVVLFVILWRRLTRKLKKGNIYESTNAKNVTNIESVYDELANGGSRDYVNTLQSDAEERTNV